MRHPFLRVDHLPALVEIARTRSDVGVLFRHALPRARIAVLECEVLGVGTVAEDDRKFSLVHRAKHVGAQHRSIVHGDRHVKIDPHAVTNFRSLLQRRHYVLRLPRVSADLAKRRWPGQARPCKVDARAVMPRVWVALPSPSFRAPRKPRRYRDYRDRFSWPSHKCLSWH